MINDLDPGLNLLEYRKISKKETVDRNQSYETYNRKQKQEKKKEKTKSKIQNTKHKTELGKQNREIRRR